MANSSLLDALLFEPHRDRLGIAGGDCRTSARRECRTGLLYRSGSAGLTENEHGRGDALAAAMLTQKRPAQYELFFMNSNNSSTWQKASPVTVSAQP